MYFSFSISRKILNNTSMGIKTMIEQLEQIKDQVPKVQDAKGEVQEETPILGEEEKETRRRERRASNEANLDIEGLSDSQRKELFESQKKKLEAEERRANEETRHLKSEKFLCGSIGGAILLMAGGAFAIIAQGLMSGRSDRK